MSDFDKIYQHLTNIATKQISKLNLPIEPMELVNQSYIQCVEENIPFTINNAVKFIFAPAYEEIKFFKAHKQNEFYVPTKEHERFCKKCGESKPIAAFYILNKFHLEDISTDCKECRIAAAMKRYHSNKVEWLIKAKQYKDANKEKIRIKKQQWYVKNISGKPIRPKIKALTLKERVKNLTDAYIKSLLRRLGIFNPSMQQINEKRKEIKLLRKRKAPKKITQKSKKIAA